MNVAANKEVDGIEVYLEHFDLTAGDVKSFGSAVAVSVGVRFDLDAEGHALFSAVLLWGEFSADAVDLNKTTRTIMQMKEEKITRAATIL